jgi:hypothetical protein
MCTNTHCLYIHHANTLKSRTANTRSALTFFFLGLCYGVRDLDITLYLHIVIVYFSVYNLMMATMRGRNM